MSRDLKFSGQRRDISTILSDSYFISYCRKPNLHTYELLEKIRVVVVRGWSGDTVLLSQLALLTRTIAPQ